MKLDELRQQLLEDEIDEHICPCCKRTSTDYDYFARGELCMSCRRQCRDDGDGTYVHYVERNRIEVITECPECGDRKRFAIARGDKVTVRCKCGCESSHDVERVRVPGPELDPEDDEDEKDDELDFAIVKRRRPWP